MENSRCGAPPTLDTTARKTRQVVFDFKGSSRTNPGSVHISGGPVGTVHSSTNPLHITDPGPDTPPLSRVGLPEPSGLENLFGVPSEPTRWSYNNVGLLMLWLGVDTISISQNRDNKSYRWNAGPPTKCRCFWAVRQTRRWSSTLRPEMQFTRRSLLAAQRNQRTETQYKKDKNTNMCCVQTSVVCIFGNVLLVWAGQFHIKASSQERCIIIPCIQSKRCLGSVLTWEYWFHFESVDRKQLRHSGLASAQLLTKLQTCWEVLTGLSRRLTVAWTRWTKVNATNFKALCFETKKNIKMRLSDFTSLDCPPTRLKKAKLLISKQL